jgi:hypothetical protein
MGLIGGLVKNRVLAVNSGFLPQSVFQLMVEASNLPALMEGANSLNLYGSLGKPYLSVLPNNLNTPYLRAPCQKPDETVAKLVELTAALCTDEPDDDTTKLLLDYFTGANANPNTVLNGYFPALQTIFMDPKMNQVEWALYRLALTEWSD